MNALENPCWRVSLRNHSFVRLVHFPTLFYISYHCAPLLPTLCPDCSCLLFHVKRNVSQNENYFCRSRPRFTRVRVFHSGKTTISCGPLRAQLRLLVLLWPQNFKIVL